MIKLLTFKNYTETTAVSFYNILTNFLQIALFSLSSEISVLAAFIYSCVVVLQPNLSNLCLVSDW